MHPVSWPEYHQKIEDLAAKIYQSKWQFNQIICLGRGGLRVGDILSRIFDLPLGILMTSSYQGKERGKLKIADNLTMINHNPFSHVLLVDDLVDSGISLEQTLVWLKNHYTNQIKEVKTAVIWYKAKSIITPDYYVDYLPDNHWIHQPFECYDNFDRAKLE